MNDAFLKQAKARAAKYCSQRERAPQQVLEKLLSWDLTTQEALNIISQLSDENFLNEGRFCRAFCHDKFEFNKWGKNRIKLELGKYELPGQVIEEGLQHIAQERYEEVLRHLAEKKWRSLTSEADIWKRKHKTSAFLIRKGFETGLVWEIVNEYAEED